MYSIVLPCGNIMEFLNDEQFLIWAEKYGNCYKGCWEKDCKFKKEIELAKEY